MKRLFTFIMLLFTCINVCVAKDICFQIMANPPTHDVSQEVKDRARYKKGAIVHVYLNSQCPEPPSPNNPMVFVRVTGVPVSAAKKIRDLLTAPQFEMIDIPDSGGEQLRMDTARREWYVDWTQLPQQFVDNLLENREVTKTWAQVKPFIKSAVLQRAITDEDLE